jgi:serine/threonine-protein kinase
MSHVAHRTIHTRRWAWTLRLLCSVAGGVVELVLDRYRVVRRLAKGGMGELWLACDTRSQRHVALKRLLPRYRTQPHLVERFEHEGDVLAQLAHEHVVRLQDVGAWGGSFVLALEHIDGTSVAELAEQRSQPVPVALAVRIAHDAALGLHHAHVAVDRRGKPLRLVHRDVSPHNLMVSRDGVVKLIDFGIVADTVTAAAEGEVCGKLAYMAPEQARGDVVDARADQYALGVVLRELLVGHHLFRGAHTAPEALDERAALCPLRHVLLDVQPELARVVDRMLSFDREARFESCLATAAALAEVLRSVGADGEREALAAFVRAHSEPLVASSPWSPRLLTARDATQATDLTDIDVDVDVEVATVNARPRRPVRWFERRSLLVAACVALLGFVGLGVGRSLAHDVTRPAAPGTSPDLARGHPHNAHGASDTQRTG